MKEYIYKPQGVCSTEMHIFYEGDTIKDLVVVRGCNGNLKGIAKLVSGMKIDDVISRLEGITCREKSTSCPDQLAQGLKKLKQEEFSR
jgi:uncharacterized protein (TIGR03905 family)